MLLSEIKTFKYEFIQCHWKEYLLTYRAINGRTKNHLPNETKKVWFDRRSGEIRFIKNEAQIFHSRLDRLNVKLYTGKYNNKKGLSFKVYVLFRQHKMIIFFIQDYCALHSKDKFKINKRLKELTI